jgi:hypothetical protein
MRKENTLSISLNEWTRKSLELANTPGYLDRLIEIYPATVLPRRPLDEGMKEEIRLAHQKGDWKKLVELLLELKKKKTSIPYRTSLCLDF